MPRTTKINAAEKQAAVEDAQDAQDARDAVNEAKDAAEDAKDAAADAKAAAKDAKQEAAVAPPDEPPGPPTGRAAAAKADPPPDQPPGPPTAAAQLPAVHSDGSCWTEDEHDQAVAVYLRAVESGDPDAGRMRTVIGLHKHPHKGIGKESGVKI